MAWSGLQIPTSIGDDTVGQANPDQQIGLCVLCGKNRFV